MRLLIGALLLVIGLAACDASPPADTGKTEGSQGTPPVAEVAPATPAPASAPVAVGAIDRSRAGQPAPDTTFTDRGGKPVRIADFAGTPVLVNLWATWCAPCIAEMPALDRLAVREAGDLTVVAVSQDLEGWRAVDGFFTPGKFKAVQPYLDQPNALASALGAQGLPMTILYDARGRELWRVNGPKEWDQPEVAKLLPVAASQPSEQRDPWMSAKARGIDFRAVGNEPGWYLEIDAGGQMRMVADYGERTVVAPAPPRIEPTDSASYAATTGDHALAVSVRREACSDGMSDARYPLAVTVKLDDKVYRGCGRYL